MGAHRVLRNPRTIESGRFLSSPRGHAWLITTSRRCCRIHGHQSLFQILHIVAESCLVSIGDADKFKAEYRPWRPTNHGKFYGQW